MKTELKAQAVAAKNRSGQRILGLCAVASATVIGASLMAMSAQASTLTLINNYSDPTTGTGALGINNAGYVTGTVVNADGSQDGFIRAPNGTYTLFSDGPQTVGRSVSATGYVTGYATDLTGDLTTDTEFVRAPDGTFTTLINPNTNAPITGIAQQMNASGAIVGDDITGTAPRFGFVLDGSTFTDLNTQTGYHVVAARGINDAGVIVGWGTNLNAGITEAYVDTMGVFQWFSDPNPDNGGNTAFESINNNGIAAGFWTDTGGETHAIEFNTNTDVFTEIGIPAGQTFSESFGINDSNIAIVTTDTNNYLYNPTGVPEPATWAILLTGVFGLGGVLRRRRAAALSVA